MVVDSAAPQMAGPGIPGV